MTRMLCPICVELWKGEEDRHMVPSEDGGAIHDCAKTGKLVKFSSEFMSNAQAMESLTKVMGAVIASITKAVGHCYGIEIYTPQWTEWGGGAAGAIFEVWVEVPKLGKFVVDVDNVGVPRVIIHPVTSPPRAPFETAIICLSAHGLMLEADARWAWVLRLAPSNVELPQVLPQTVIEVKCLSAFWWTNRKGKNNFVAHNVSMLLDLWAAGLSVKDRIVGGALWADSIFSKQIDLSVASAEAGLSAAQRQIESGLSLLTLAQMFHSNDIRTARAFCESANAQYATAQTNVRAADADLSLVAALVSAN